MFCHWTPPVLSVTSPLTGRSLGKASMIGHFHPSLFLSPGTFFPNIYWGKKYILSWLSDYFKLQFEIFIWVILSTFYCLFSVSFLDVSLSASCLCTGLLHSTIPLVCTHNLYARDQIHTHTHTHTHVAKVYVSILKNYKNLQKGSLF